MGGEAGSQIGSKSVWVKSLGESPVCSPISPGLSSAGLPVECSPPNPFRKERGKDGAPRFYV
jgi:hypothetical protein